MAGVLRASMTAVVSTMIVGLVAPGPVDAQAPKSTHKFVIKSAYTTTSATMTPLWTAKEGGYFDDEGLDVTLTRIQPGPPVLGAVQSREVPVAFVGAQQIVNADLKGATFVIVAAFDETLSQALYVHQSIERPEQLKGKAIGVTNFGAITHVAAKEAVKHLGLEGQVTYLATGGPPETLAAMQFGKLAAATFSPPDSFKARELGFRELLDLSKLGIKTLGAAVVTTREFARDKPDVVERYIRASLKGTHRAKTDREFTLKVISKYTKQTSAPILNGTYDYFREHWMKDGIPSAEALQKNIEVAAAELPEAKNARPEQFWDLTFIKKINASGFVDQLWKKSP
jgi:NitT/TauT family transport system substrate-binding protein